LQPFRKGDSLVDHAAPIAGLLSQLTELLGQASKLKAGGRDAQVEEIDQYEIVYEDADESEDEDEDEDENAVEDTDSD
jgi:hypothetical protein